MPSPPSPNVGRSDVTYWKGIFGKPSLTSFFQCWFYPTAKSREWINKRGLDFTTMQENISFLCHEASLPGTRLTTNEIFNDYHGVTERLPYRRQFDESMDFTFYVDHYGARGSGGIGRSHNIIWFFENWIQHIMHESIDPISGKPSNQDQNYFYRVSFPVDYQTDIYINKFEKDYTGTFLEYRFIQSYPLSISSMPVSYDSSQVLKCNVSFSFNRYTVQRKPYSIAGQIRDNQVLNNSLGLLNPVRTRTNETPAQTSSSTAASVAAFLRY